MWQGPNWNGWKAPNLEHQDNTDVYLLFAGIVLFVIGAICLKLVL